MRSKWQLMTVACLIVATLALLFGPAIWAQTAGKYYRTQSTNTRFTGDVYMTAGAEQAFDFSDAAVTTATTTINVNGKHGILLTTDANVTGLSLVGGELDQVVVIRSGAGTHTMRFDDGASQSLGADVTLTEGQNDVLALQCLNAEGDEWYRLWNSDN